MKHYLHFRWKGLVLYLGIHLGNTSVIPSRYDLNWHFELKKDPRLGWNSTKLEVTSINHERIWTPDVTYWNSVADETELDFPADRGSLRVFSERIQRPTYQWRTNLYGWSVDPFFSDGTVYWSVAGTLFGHCKCSVRNFPYDTQERYEIYTK